METVAGSTTKQPEKPPAAPPIKRAKKPNPKAECPYCHKVVGNVKNHIIAVHPTQDADRRAALPSLDKDVILGKKPANLIERPVQPEDVRYYCQDCRAELRKGEENCWNCGKAMDWNFLNLTKEGE